MTTARFDSIQLKVICLALVTAYPVLAEAGVAGRVQFVAGDVRIIDEKGAQRPMRKGQDVNEGDTVLSGPDGSAQVKMIDGAIVAVRPGTELKVIDYAFDEMDRSKESASFSLVKGGLRAITGLIGKTNKDRYKLTTPTATIGIRGTDHEPVVVLPGADSLQSGAVPGTYDKVNVGATSLTTEAGTTVVAANQVGFAASPTQLPVILPKMPDFYRAAPAPRQEAQKQEQEKKQADASSTGSEQSSSSESKSAGAGSETAAATKTATTTAPTASLTAVDASGNTLNLSNQTITTASGQSLGIGGDVPATPTVPTTPVPQPAGNYEQVIATYPAQVSPEPGQNFTYPAMFFFGGPSEAVTRDATGSIVAVTDSGTDFLGYRTTLSQSGATMADFGSHAAAGLSWGRWQGGQVTQSTQYVGMDATGKWGMGAYNDEGDFVIGGVQTERSASGGGSLHWISGKVATPEYLTRVLTGTATYALAGGTRPTDQNGNIGTLNSASLGVNFATQMVNAGVNFSIGGNTWALQSNDMALLDGPHFSSYNWCADTCSSNTTLTKNGAPVGSTSSPTTGFAFASMNGTLLGTGLNGAALQYAVQETVPTTQVGSNGETITNFTQSTIQGVAAFTGPTQDVQTPFRIVGVTDGWDSGLDLVDEGLDVNAEGAFRGAVDGGEAPVARVVDGPGGLTEFLGSAMGFTPVSASMIDAEIPATIKIGTAANRDVGSTTIAGTTVSWGRWEGGSIDIYSRDGSTRLGTIDNSGRSVHWVASSVLSGNTFFGNLPLTGTATYTIAGNTNPTDFLGNVGTLNSATLNADFANAKVNAGVNVSFNAPTNTSNWVMTANNIPIGGKDGFGSSTVLNGVNGVAHTASCTGPSCGAQTIGHFDGAFIGGGQGAVLMYGMATGATSPASGSSPAAFTPSNATTGVVIMKR